MLSEAVGGVETSEKDFSTAFALLTPLEMTKQVYCYFRSVLAKVAILRKLFHNFTPYFLKKLYK